MTVERIRLTPTETPNEKRVPLFRKPKPCTKGKHVPIVPSHPEKHPRFHGTLTITNKKTGAVRQFAKCKACGWSIMRSAESMEKLGDWELRE